MTELFHRINSNVYDVSGAGGTKRDKNCLSFWCWQVLLSCSVWLNSYQRAISEQMQCTDQRWDQYECQHWDKYKCQHCMFLSLQQRDLHQVVTTRRNLLSSMEAEPSRSQSISWAKFNLLEFMILLFLGVTYNWCVCLILNQCAYWKLWVVQNCITPVQVEDIWSHPLQSIALAEWKKNCPTDLNKETHG